MTALPRESLWGGARSVQAFRADSWRFLAYLVIASSGFNGALGSAFGYFTIRPDWCLGAVAALLLCSAAPWTPAEAWRRQLRGPIAIGLVVFVAVHVVASVLNASGWPAGLKFMNVYVLGLAVFLVMLRGIRSWPVLEGAVRLWICVAAITSIWGGLAALVSNMSQRTIAGAEPILAHEGLLFYAGRGGALEPNIFGSSLLVPFALGLWYWTDDRSSRYPFRAASLVIAFGLVASHTRAAWLGGAAIVLVWVWQQRPRLGAVAALVGATVLSVLALQASLLPPRWSAPWPRADRAADRQEQPDRQGQPVGDGIIRLRLIDPMVRGFDYNLAVRWRINGAVFSSWRDSGRIGWALGRGSGSTNAIEFVLKMPGRQDRLERMWTGNAFLFTLHDAGIVGLAAFTVLVVAVAYQLRSMLQLARTGTERRLCVALAVSVTGLLFAYQFTHALWQMSTYVVLGLVVVAFRVLAAGGGPSE
jgi:hypothetical protein